MLQKHSYSHFPFFFYLLTCWSQVGSGHWSANAGFSHEAAGQSGSSLRAYVIQNERPPWWAHAAAAAYQNGEYAAQTVLRSYPFPPQQLPAVKAEHDCLYMK